MEISDTPDVVDLLDKVLNIAIKITESKYGYIYRYDEQKRQFILNTWSKDVHADCKVVKRQTTYDLDKTGCWGEVVRQGTPFLLNDYSSKNEFVKGIPKGHIEIKKILAIPVSSNNEIAATIGVANKDFDYDEGDIRQLTLLMNATWKIVEQKDYEEKLVIAKEKAEGSDRLKSAFLSNISHEIRTPLNGLLGFSRLLSDDRYDEIDKYKFLQNINQSGERLTQTIDAMIDMSIIDANLIEINLSIISVHDLLNALTAIFKPEAEKKGLEFICTNTEDVKIQVDEYKLKTVLSNLIQNSLKFTEKGKLELGFNSYEDSNEFFVYDTGIGVPMTQQAKIFNLFEQVENDYTRNFQGIGLGLSIAKAYVEAMGGGMSMESVESDPESGVSGWSIFKVAIKNHIKIEAV
ncbi:MAG: GAF domain-containing sensor histidine kinase [Spirochaetales bacterium]|nr:GAF domain-containing sensor histidine kinase [Spirochaetales bacterium]